MHTPLHQRHGGTHTTSKLSGAAAVGVEAARRSPAAGRVRERLARWCCRAAAARWRRSGGCRGQPACPSGCTGGAAGAASGLGGAAQGRESSAGALQAICAMSGAGSGGQQRTGHHAVRLKLRRWPPDGPPLASNNALQDAGCVAVCRPATSAQCLVSRRWRRCPSSRGVAARLK